MKRLLALAVWLYRGLIRLYPAEFRRVYGKLLIQIFRDVSRDTYHQHGLAGLGRWWGITFFDLVCTVIEQRRTTMIFTRSNLAAIFSLLLCLPLLFMVITATLDYEPPFVQALESADGYTPTLLGRLVMLAMLFSVPLALVVNLTFSHSDTPFTPTHTFIGMTLLCAVLLLFSEMVLHELQPITQQGEFLLLGGLLVSPALILILPHFNKVQVAPLNLIVGAVILLIILMLVAAFMLEALACSSGVPNCD